MKEKAQRILELLEEIWGENILSDEEENDVLEMEKLIRKFILNPK